jgi:hypothetical protein
MTQFLFLRSRFFIFGPILLTEKTRIEHEATFLAHCKQFVASNEVASARMLSMAHCLLRATYCSDQSCLICIAHCSLQARRVASNLWRTAHGAVALPRALRAT